MRLFSAIALVCPLLACGGGTGGSEAEAVPEVPGDSSNTSVVEQEIPAAAVTYSTIEDYATITTKEQLISEFGEENLVDGESWYAEGTVRYEHTVLTDPCNGQVIRYVWQEDGNTLSHVEAGYFIFDDDYYVVDTQEVFSVCGVFTGMSLQDLREWNGTDFDFLGFGWDYEGLILAGEGSRIAECPVRMKLSFDMQREIPEEYLDMYGDVTFNTADDIAREAPVLVDLLTLYPSE
ncbi:MAG: hypothetical protein AVO35_02530 [Candidatus Aegiribacteria sp. MLS_C]|nr:MAG: hypothetical protein AVO35_02530 [Candidatus Aegiribacteria sp. MLS_C]